MAHPLAPYPTPEERAQRFTSLVARVGGEVLEYGRSVEGRPLLAARIPPSGAPRSRGGVARILCTANIHGLEFVSSLVLLGFLEALEHLAALRELRARAEIWLVPSVNPDGYARVWEAEGVGPLAALRTNARGVDLNRNFPLPPGQRRKRWPGAGSPRAGAATYRGPDVLSEPEAKALADLLAEQRFTAGLNGHSFMGRIIPPRVLTGEDDRAYRQLAAAFARGQPDVAYGRLAFRTLDTFTGELEDFQHHVHHTWAVCLETFPIARSFAQHLRAPSTFWRFNPRDPGPWIANDVPGMASYLHAALALADAGSRAS